MSRPAPNAFLGLLQELRTSVDRRLESLIESEKRSFGAFGQEVEDMLDAALVLCRGGKRLRAGLLAAGHAAAGGRASQSECVLGAGVAVELLQSYFLIHDDWMDEDTTRRGNPTVHVDLAGRFGDAHLGACGAVLAGDFLVTLAHREFHRVALEASESGRIPVEALLREFSRMQLSAIAGQQLDVICRTRSALTVYELKTGSYTVSGPLSLGLLLGGASVDTLALAEAFAVPVGIAFQLRDDLLNLFGAPEETGKPRGSDLTAGKWTWTAQWVREHAGPAELTAFDAVFGKRGVSPALVSDALAAVRDCGALAATEDFIRRQEELGANALAELGKKLPASAGGVALLESAVTALVHRST